MFQNVEVMSGEDGECNCTPGCNGKNWNRWLRRNMRRMHGTDECVSGTCSSKVDMEGPEYKGRCSSYHKYRNERDQSIFQEHFLFRFKDNIVSSMELPLSVKFLIGVGTVTLTFHKGLQK